MNSCAGSGCQQSGRRRLVVFIGPLVPAAETRVAPSRPYRPQAGSDHATRASCSALTRDKIRPADPADLSLADGTDRLRSVVRPLKSFVSGEASIPISVWPV